MTKEEAIAKLREQGHEVTPEEAKALEALLATGDLDDASLEKIVGGLDPRFKKLLIGAGILALGVGGTYGTYRTVKHFSGRKGAAKPPMVPKPGEEGSKEKPIDLTQDDPAK